MITVLQHYQSITRKLSRRLSQYCLNAMILFVNKIKKIPIFSYFCHVSTKTATSAVKIKIFIIINSNIKHNLKVKNNVVSVENSSLAVIYTAMIAAMRSLKNLSNIINNLNYSLRRLVRQI